MDHHLPIDPWQVAVRWLKPIIKNKKCKLPGWMHIPLSKGLAIGSTESLEKMMR